MLARLLIRWLRPYTGLLTGVVLVQVVATVAGLALPNLNAQIIDNGVSTGDTGYIMRRGALMLSVSLVQVLAQAVAAYLGARAAMSLGRDLRADIFDRVLSFSTREVNQFGAPSLITRTTNDVQQVQQLVLMSAIMLISAPITMVGGVIMALRQDVKLSAVILVAVLVLGAFVGVIVSLMSPLFRQNQERLDNLNRVVREQISGIRVVRAFVREPRERARFEATNHDLMDISIRIGTLFAMLFPFVMLVMNGSSLAVMWFGGHRIDAGDLQVGQLTAFLTYLMQILMSVIMATMMTIMVPRAQVCARRIMEVMDTESSVVPPAVPRTEVPTGGRVEFRDVSFCYPGAEEPVLKHLTFTMQPGTTTAVIGATGSGKTTLVNLVPRLVDVTAGQVLVDGVDVREFAPDDLWRRVGLVPQKAYLFSGTVASNLRYGDPQATPEQMWQALRTAQADDFVAEMTGGLEAEIAQAGTNVSGGQRQRLSIARALIKHPEIHIFDDAFSALDVATDARLRRALATESAESTVLIVGQRIATVREADQIIVLDAGQIVGIGTHNELLGSCETYREIVDSQRSVEEAA